MAILQNDNAEGVFFISNSTRGPFVLEESVAEIIEITIEREGGALTNQLIQYEIPGGRQDLIGGFGFANFVATQRSFMVTILVNDDTVPEINESFNFTISAVGGNLNILGSPTYVEITILANDEFAGVFLFAASSRSLFVGESHVRCGGDLLFRGEGGGGRGKEVEKGGRRGEGGRGGEGRGWRREGGRGGEGRGWRREGVEEGGGKRWRREGMEGEEVEKGGRWRGREGEGRQKEDKEIEG